MPPTFRHPTPFLGTIYHLCRHSHPPTHVVSIKGTTIGAIAPTGALQSDNQPVGLTHVQTVYRQVWVGSLISVLSTSIFYLCMITLFALSIRYYRPGMPTPYFESAHVNIYILVSISSICNDFAMAISHGLIPVALPGGRGIRFETRMF